MLAESEPRPPQRRTRAGWGLGLLAATVVAGCQPQIVVEFIDDDAGATLPPDAGPDTATPTPDASPDAVLDEVDAQSPPPPRWPEACSTEDEPGDHWPTYDPGATYAAVVKQGKSEYVAGKYEWRLAWAKQYVPNGDYLNFAFVRPFATLGPDMKWGPDGVPMVYSDNGGNPGYFYNIVTFSQFALYHHSLYMRGAPLDKAFWAAVDRLLAMQDASGAFRYPYFYWGGGISLGAGWTSAMAQGHALSVLARAYTLTKDPKYLEAGRKALQFLLVPVDAGGNRSNLSDLDPSLSRLTWLEEYPEKEPNHTLNGYMFTLLGLLDWWGLDPKQASGSHATAGTWYLCGLHSLDKAIPYFDLGGFSNYDVVHLTRGTTPIPRASYHRVHVMLLWALATNHPHPENLLPWVDRWAGDVNQPRPGEGVEVWP